MDNNTDYHSHSRFYFTSKDNGKNETENRSKLCDVLHMMRLNGEKILTSLEFKKRNLVSLHIQEKSKHHSGFYKSTFSDTEKKEHAMIKTQTVWECWRRI